MSISELGSLGEFVGSFAVFATLVYLAIQLRQNTNSVRGSNELEVSRQQMDITGQIIADSELRDLWHRAATQETMDDKEQLKYLWLMVQWFDVSDGWYRLHKRGLISDDYWETLLTTTIGYLQQPIVADWFDSNTSNIAEDFRKYIREQRDDPSRSWTVRDTAKFIEKLAEENNSHK